jgi:exodeoxyribonuclease VII small subunit
MANQHKRPDDDTATAGSNALPTGAERFEDQLETLEEIVTRIDSGELSLEESIDAFERGVGLVRSLNRKLDEVERRVEVLMRGAGGELQNTPYAGETGAGDNGGVSKKADDEDPPF